MKLWIGLQDHVILIGLGIERRDLTLAESVVQSVIDGFRINAHAGSGYPVYREIQ